MNIQTKFKVGDEVFTIDKKTLRMKKITLDKVYVYVTETDGIEISYRGEGELYDDVHDESVCFTTEHELLSYVKSE